MRNTSPAPLTVAIVDDSIPVRQRVAESLAGIPRVVVGGAVGDVPAGARLLDEIDPAVLILDIELPLQSGIDLLRIAKRRRRPPVVIMLSIYEQPAFRRRCAELGADYYFNKLTEFERVAEVCRQLVARLP